MDELVEKAKKNDIDAFTKLILNIRKDLYCIAKTRINDENDIDDVIQETMITAFLKLKKLRDNKLFKTWIIKILINNCNKLYKKEKHKSLNDEEVQNKIEFFEIDLSGIEFNEFISFLNEDERTILTLYYYLGYTTKEISKILNKSEGTICSKISRSKTKIKNKYKGEFN